MKPGDCDAAWALCAKNNKQLATFRPDPYSSEGKKPLTWKTLLQELLRDLISSGAHIDGIGLQSHIAGNITLPSEKND